MFLNFNNNYNNLNNNKLKFNICKRIPKNFNSLFNMC